MELLMDEAIEFLTALTSGYNDRSLRLNMRYLQAKTNYAKNSFFPITEGGIELAAEEAIERSKGWNSYCGVLPRVGKEGAAIGVNRARWLFCDVDGGNEGVQASLFLLDASGLPVPDIINISGGGIHCYWSMSEIVDLSTDDAKKRYTSVINRIGRKIGGSVSGAHGDSGVKDCARILRIPGTLNHKTDPPKEVKSIMCVTDYGDQKPYEWWNDMLPQLPIKDYEIKSLKSKANGYSSDGEVTPYLLNWSKTGYPEGNRHDDLVGGAIWLIKECKLSKSDALSLLTEKAINSLGARAITERELEDMIKWA